MDQLPRLGKSELVCLLLFTCNYVVSVWRGFLFLWVLRMSYVISLLHSLSLPYNYFIYFTDQTKPDIIAGTESWFNDNHYNSDNFDTHQEKNRKEKWVEVSSLPLTFINYGKPART